MATLGNIVKNCAGEKWSTICGQLEMIVDPGENVPSTANGDEPSSSSMKLMLKDMSLYGLCPSRDACSLVSCRLCGLVVKPQALLPHIELRHGSKEHPHQIEKSVAVPEKCSSQNFSTPASRKKNSSSPSSSSRSSRKRKKPDKKKKSDQKPTSVLNNHLEPKSTSNPHQIKDEKPSTSKTKNHLVVTTSVVEGQSTITNYDVQSVPDRASFDTLEELTRSFEAFEKNSKREENNSNKTALLSDTLQIPQITNIQIDNRSSTPVIHIPDTAPDEPSITVHNFVPLDKVQSCPNSPALETKISLSLAGQAKRSQPPSAPSTPKFEQVGALGDGSSLGDLLTSKRHLFGTKRQESLPNLRRTPSITSPSTSSRTSSPMTSPPSTPMASTKKIALKDRVYNPDTHCGVIDSTTGKPCARSLTCKTHTLTARRAVKGRSKSFDQLLAEHRAAKEALLKQTGQQAGGAATCKSARTHPPPMKRTWNNALKNPPNMSKSITFAKPASVQDRPLAGTSLLPNRGRPPLMNMSRKFSKPVPNQTSSAPMRLEKTANEERSPQIVAAATAATTTTTVTVEAAKVNGSVDENDDDDLHYLPYHPRPAAINNFGAKRVGRSACTFRRSYSLIQQALTLVTRQDNKVNEPAYKKPCLEKGNFTPVKKPPSMSEFIGPDPATPSTSGQIKSPFQLPPPPSQTAACPAKMNSPFNSQTSIVRQNSREGSNSLLQSNTLKRKRPNTIAATTVAPSLNLPTNMAITIPASGLQLAQTAKLIPAKGPQQLSTNSVSPLKQGNIGIVLGNVDSTSLLNGQLVSLPSNVQFVSTNPLNNPVSKTAPNNGSNQQLLASAAAAVRQQQGQSQSFNMSKAKTILPLRKGHSLLAPNGSLPNASSSTVMMNTQSLLPSSQLPNSQLTAGQAAPIGLPASGFLIKKDAGGQGNNGVITSQVGSLQVRGFPLTLNQLPVAPSASGQTPITISASEFQRVTGLRLPISTINAGKTTAQGPPTNRNMATAVPVSMPQNSQLAGRQLTGSRLLPLHSPATITRPMGRQVGQGTVAKNPAGHVAISNKSVVVQPMTLLVPPPGSSPSAQHSLVVNENQELLGFKQQGQSKPIT